MLKKVRCLQNLGALACDLAVTEAILLGFTLMLLGSNADTIKLPLPIRVTQM